MIGGIKGSVPFYFFYLAAQAGNKTSLLYEVNALRQLLKKEYADVVQDNDSEDSDTSVKPRITRLAARVLDFNLAYIARP